MYICDLLRIQIQKVSNLKTSEQLSDILSKYHLFCIWTDKIHDLAAHQPSWWADLRRKYTHSENIWTFVCWRKHNGDNMKHLIVASTLNCFYSLTPTKKRSNSTPSTSTSPVVALCPPRLATKGTESIWRFQNCPAHVRGRMIQRGTCAEPVRALLCNSLARLLTKRRPSTRSFS